MITLFFSHYSSCSNGCCPNECCLNTPPATVTISAITETVIKKLENASDLDLFTYLFVFGVILLSGIFIVRWIKKRNHHIDNNIP